MMHFVMGWKLSMDERTSIWIGPYAETFLELLVKAKDVEKDVEFVEDFFYYFHQAKGGLIEAIDQGMHNARESNLL